jgi:hypothetical protein
MSNERQTKSEALFLEYCNLRGYVTKRIVAPQGTGRFADYEVLITGQRVIAEIKELQPNPEDEQLAQAMEENRLGTFGDVPGRRVRTHIEDAERQLRCYEAEQVPCIVVLYDNIVVDGSRVHPPGYWLEPYQVDVGMYGLQVVNLRLHSDGRTESLGDARGGQRTFRRAHRDHVSAVAVLHDHAPDYGLFFVIYHSYFAQVPLPKTLFIHPKDRQLEKSDPEASPGPWIQVEEGQEADTLRQAQGDKTT